MLNKKFNAFGFLAGSIFFAQRFTFLLLQYIMKLKNNVCQLKGEISYAEKGISLYYCGLVCVLLYINTSFIAIVSYEDGDFGSLTIKTDPIDTAKEKELTLKVDNEDLKKRLSQKGVADIIGANIMLTIPAKVISERHINIQNINPFMLLYDDTYEEYLVLQDVFYKSE